jgi:hypothetical protein
VRRAKARKSATDKAARRPSAGFSADGLRDRNATADRSALQVYSGQHRLGCLRPYDDGAVEAFDADDRSIGTFSNVCAAAAAIPQPEEPRP